MANTPQPVIVSARRTPIGRFMGGLSRMRAPELGALAVRAVLDDAPALREHVDEVIMGIVLQAGVGQNPARQAGINGGLGNDCVAYAVNKVCGSGLQSVALAAQAIKAGDNACVIAGGMESMSQAPHLANIRGGVKFGNAALIDHMQSDGLTCGFSCEGMGDLAEYIAAKHGVTREAQDRFAVRSHERAAAAQAQGWFSNEIVSVTAAAAKQKVDVTADEGVRADTAYETLQRLRPAFKSDGSVTAGNASQISDGAAAVAVLSEAKASALGLKPLARIVAYHTHGVEPKDIFIAPVDAVKKCVAKAGLGLKDVDLFELNEAFAAQALANLKYLEIPEDKVNVCGGAIALGHPIGASGTRVLVTLVHQLHRLGLRRGVAALCLGGGNAIAMLVERA